MKKKTKIAWRYIKHLLGWFVRASWIIQSKLTIFYISYVNNFCIHIIFIVWLSFCWKRLRFFMNPIIEVIACLYFGKRLILLWFSGTLPIFLMILCQNMKFKGFCWDLIPCLNEFIKSDWVKVSLKFWLFLSSEVESGFWNLLTDKIKHRLEIVVRNREFSFNRLSEFLKLFFG